VSEGELIRRAQERRGSPEGDAAFAAIVERLQGRVFTQILGRVSDRERARELLQETFLRAYEALPRFRPEAKLRTWVGRIAQNLCVDEARRQAAGRGSVRSLDDPGAGSGLGLVATLSGVEGDAAAKAVEAEERAQVRQAVARLKPIYREIVHLRVYEDLTYAEIAELLGCSASAAKQRMFQATQLLRKEL
jgi:RNA polymerase sigma-70 factor (ECF subfamily)